MSSPRGNVRRNGIYKRSILCHTSVFLGKIPLRKTFFLCEGLSSQQYYFIEKQIDKYFYQQIFQIFSKKCAAY